jgi:lysophospholipase L1-like esterase
VPDYKELIGKFKALAGHPQIFICQPTPVPGNGNWGINEPTVQDEIKLINGIAKDENVGIIDLHRALEGKDELIPDRVHPNAAGATVLAQTVYKTLTGKEFVDGVPAESSAK